jgi:hypothetical protein
MKKYFLTTKKIKNWYMNNKQEDVLLAKLKDNLLPIPCIENGIKTEIYLDITDNDIEEDYRFQVGKIDKLSYVITIIKENDQDTISRVFNEPELGAWTEEEDV